MYKRLIFGHKRIRLLAAVCACLNTGCRVCSTECKRRRYNKDIIHRQFSGEEGQRGGGQIPLLSTVTPAHINERVPLCGQHCHLIEFPATSRIPCTPHTAGPETAGGDQFKAEASHGSTASRQRPTDRPNDRPRRHWLPSCHVINSEL